MSDFFDEWNAELEALFLSPDWPIFVTYYEVLRSPEALASEIDPDFGYALEQTAGETGTIPATAGVVLPACVCKPKGARKKLGPATDQFLSDQDVLVVLSGAVLRSLSVTVKRDNCFVRLASGVDLRVETVEHLPVGATLPVLVHLLCSRRKPQSDAPGAP